ncbi:MAG: hypothetical protein ACRDXX_03865, partial [Stackebrandtia sp.]
MNALSANSVSVKVLPDTKTFAQRLKAFLRTTAAREVVHVDVEADASRLAASVRVAADRASRNGVDVDVLADSRRLAEGVRVAVRTAEQTAPDIEVDVAAETRGLAADVRRAARVAEA